MTDKDLIEIADRHYPDGLVAQAFEQGDQYTGEFLARFIAEELRYLGESYPTTAEQLETAEERMRTAIDELGEVADAFMRAREQATADASVD